MGRGRQEVDVGQDLDIGQDLGDRTWATGFGRRDLGDGIWATGFGRRDLDVCNRTWK